MKAASSRCTIRMKPVSRHRAHSGAPGPPDWEWLCASPFSKQSQHLGVHTIFRSARSLWASCGQRRALCALVGRGIDRQLQRVGCTPSPRANLVLWHMHRLFSYDRPLPCHQTRAANSSSTFLSFASDPEIGKGCGLFARSAKAQPHIILLLAHRNLHELLATCLNDRRPLRPDSLEHTKRSLLPTQPHLAGTRPLFSSHHMHAFRRAIPGFPTAFGPRNKSRI